MHEEWKSTYHSAEEDLVWLAVGEDLFRNLCSEMRRAHEHAPVPFLWWHGEELHRFMVLLLEVVHE